MGKTKIKIHLEGEGRIIIEIEIYKFLSEIRKDLLDVVKFPFIFLDDDDNEIPKEKESATKLEDILDGKNLTLKKIDEKIMLGRKIESKNRLDFYLYPQINLTNEEKDKSLNIMILGETGVGKSTWLHSLINYIQNIQFEENNRYYLFDEKNLKEKYHVGYGITKNPTIYDIKASNPLMQPLRIIDTPGFGDIRGQEYDEIKVHDIINLLKNSDIEYLNAICLMFKANQNRVTDRFNMIINQIFSLFGEDIKNNIIILFSFADDFDNILALNILKDKNGIFYNLIGNDKFHHFTFNNFAYFSNNKNEIKYIYNANTKNFSNFFEYISSIKKISLESTKKVIIERMTIKNNIINFSDKLKDIKVMLNNLNSRQMLLLRLAGELKNLSFGNKNEDNEILKTNMLINKQIEVENKKCEEEGQIFNNYLKEAIDNFYQIAIKNNELNLFALKKDNQKLGFISEILIKNINFTKVDKFYEIFLSLLESIEKLFENSISKEEIYNNIRNKLFMIDKD